jgi:hypothetical protein
MSLMKGYNKKQGIKLQRKVLSSLFIAGAAYVCILGGGQRSLGI